MQHNLITHYPFRTKVTDILSKREHSVLTLISEGYSSSQIADALFLSYETIRSHRKNMMRKLDATNTASLITKSFKIGLLSA